jgi:hypothetical protein
MSGTATVSVTRYTAVGSPNNATDFIRQVLTHQNRRQIYKKRLIKTPEINRKFNKAKKKKEKQTKAINKL